MNRRLALSVLGALLPGLLAASAANAQRRAVPPEVLPDTMQLAMTTEAGRIVIELDLKHAPVTARNFLRYADQRRFDGTVFYRVMRLAWGDPPNGLIQGGTRGDRARVLPPIAHEP
ncbi:MAG TPA: peptidylprolyl isomerase, partial [Novosphingobium sp.]|nr:peptidylprolyl isomerase [Novosphingobium sp.]